MRFKYHKPRRPEPPRPDAAAYNSARWRRLRLQVIRGEPVCRACLDALAEDVDHIDGDNRNNALSNLQALCRPCHNRKTHAR